MAVTASDGSLQWKASIDLSELKNQVGEINKALGQVGEKIQGQAEDIDRFSRNAANAIKTYLSVTAISGFVSDIVRVRGEFQQLEVAFQTILQSKEKADALMAQVVELAAKTPFGLQDAAKGAKQLLAYGFAAESVTKNLTMLGDIASGVGAPLNDIVYLYGTLRTQGRAFTKDIQQFTGRGIPIIAELAKQFGVAEDKVMELVEAGKVGFPQVEEAFKSLTSEGGIFNNLMEAQSKTISGLISNFGDAWAQMLNDIGKSQEGPIANVIKGAISIVENYQKVLDVLKLLAVTYGTYRAAVIATAVAQTIAANATKGWTIAQTLQYQATLLADRAMKILNATMLTNPFVAVTTAVVALVSALAIFGKTASQTKDKAKLLSDAQGRVADKMSEVESKVRPYLEALKNVNLTESERLNIYNKLKEVDAKIVDGLDAKSISYQNLSTRVNEYLNKLREQFKLEANQEAIQESIKVEQAIEKQRDEKLKRLDAYNKRVADLQKKGDKEGLGLAQFSVIEIRTDLKVLEDDLKKQKEITQELGTVQVNSENKVQEAKKRTLQVIEEEIEAERKRQKEASTNSKEYLAIQKKIDLLEKEKIAITGNTKEIRKQEDQYDKIIDKRAKALQDIASLERDASQSGLLQKQKDLDLINEKYDKQLLAVKEVNAELQKYNDRHPGRQVSLLGDAETTRLDAARQTEIANYNYRLDAKNYIESLDEKRQAFSELEQVLKSGSTEQVEFTRNQYAQQVGQFDSYVSYLRAQIASIAVLSASGVINVGQALKLEELKKQLTTATKESADASKKYEKEAFDDMVLAAKTYATKREEIEARYNKRVQLLQTTKANKSLKVYQEESENLKKERQDELNDLGEEFLQNTDAFKDFEKGVEDLGTGAVRKLIDAFQKVRDKIKLLGADTAEVDKILKGLNVGISERSATSFREVAGIISSIGANLNIELSKTLKITSQQIGQILNNVSTLFDKDASKGSQVGSIVGLISSVVVGVRDALLTAEDLADPLQAQKDAYAEIGAEIEANNYRLERQRAILDDLVGVQKLNAQVSFLDDLKKKQDDALKSLKDFQIDFIKSSKEIYVDPLFGTEVETGGINSLASVFLWGGMEKRKMKFELEAVDTSSFDTIEDFANLLAEIKAGGGKLNGKVIIEEDIKALEQLIQTYDEAVAEQKQLRDQLNQIYTATTANAIADSIISGFRQGKRSMEDFTSDFEDLMRNAVLNSLKYQFLEAPLADFYENFAKKSASDGILTADEIAQLKQSYEQIIGKAAEQYKNLENIVNIDLAGSSNDSNSLTGAIKGMSEQTAELIAGHFAGLRMTAIQQLEIATSSLDVLNKIQLNTAKLIPMYDLWVRLERNGLRAL